MMESKVLQEPIACTLPREELPGHLAFVRREVIDKVTGVVDEAGGYRLYFAADPVMRRTLEELVAFEAGCCASLSFALAESNGQLSLAITGPAGVKEILDEVLQLPKPASCNRGATSERDVPLSKWRRWGKSGTVVGIASLVVCELPLLLLALGLGGAAVSVDAMGEIWEVAAIAAVSLPLLLWVWRRRS